jgi:hypothetical protein
LPLASGAPDRRVRTVSVGRAMYCMMSPLFLPEVGAGNILLNPFYAHPGVL